MGRDGITGDMFGNMSFDSSSDDECAADKHEADGTAVDEEGHERAGDSDAGVPAVVNPARDEVGYEPHIGPPILVRQICERGLSFQLWPAASGMCGYLENGYGGGGGESLRDARVLELGAGTGMAGMMAARFGARVTLTDLPHVLENLQCNVELNLKEVEACGGSVAVQPLRWGVEEDAKNFVSPPPDLILASDCVYYDTLFEPLMQTLKWLCGIGEGEKETPGIGSPVVLVAHLRRWKKDGQFFRMAAKCFNVEVVHRHPLVNSRVGVVVYKLTRKISSQ
ncbi:uncharacterized protein [Physcomitrium patens]|uniref:Uncharacterized protein n=1 Tax=Physcomitrium patens TaxID=3218 RepID=A0A2K1LBF2_PHYPA|nr:protein-lysine methyltransferase METTL21D-like [Physcomitrium patens]PNR63347.1 hypothetical protein PHYPA_001772 [Physcomitrium patens]|eukprot:XP_024357031.1 protein-lysine methyltransferase METTL21D-like [Physcomitrella patens]